MSRLICRNFTSTILRRKNNFNFIEERKTFDPMIIYQFLKRNTNWDLSFDYLKFRFKSNNINIISAYGDDEKLLGLTTHHFIPSILQLI